MADNVTADPGSGGATFRTDDDGTAHWPYSKIAYGPDNTQTRVTISAGLPVQQQSSATFEVVGDAAHDAAVSGNPVLVGAEFDDTATDGVDEGDVGRLRISANRNLYVGIRDAAGNERGLNVDASGQIAVTQGGTWNIGTLTTVTTVSTVTNVAQLGGAAVSMGTGARDAGTQRVTIATNDVVPASQSGTWNITNVSGTVSLPTGAATESTLSTLDGKVTACNTGAVVISSGTITSIGTSVTPGTGATNLGKAVDDIAGGTDVGVSILGIRDDALGAISPAEGDYVPFRLDANGALWVTHNGTMTVDLGANNDVQGSAAHDAAVSGNPFLQAAEARNSEGTAVSNADVVRLMADLVGKLITQPFAPTDLHWQNDGSKTDTSDLALAAAAGAGVRNYITDLIIANSSATATTAIVKDGATEIARFPVPANGGVVKTFGTPFRTTANTALNIASAASLSTMYFSATGYTGR